MTSDADRRARLEVCCGCDGVDEIAYFNMGMEFVVSQSLDFVHSCHLFFTKSCKSVYVV